MTVANSAEMSLPTRAVGESGVARRGLDCTLYQLSGDDLPFETHWQSLHNLGDDFTALFDVDHVAGTDVEKGHLLGVVQLAPLPRLGEKSAENIVRSVRASLQVPFQRVLFGLGIRFVKREAIVCLAILR